MSEWDEGLKGKECWDVYAQYPNEILMNSKDVIWRKRKTFR